MRRVCALRVVMLSSARVGDVGSLARCALSLVLMASGPTGCRLAPDPEEAARISGDQDMDTYIDCALVENATPCDCDDGDPSIYPGATEECDDADQDCNPENDLIGFKRGAVKMSWFDARVTCYALGRPLLVMNTSAPEQWTRLGGCLAEEDDITSEYWIGLTDLYIEGEFEWESESFSGTPVPSPPWGTSQPDEALGKEDGAGQPEETPGEEKDCVAMTTKGQAVVLPCQTELPFLCGEDSLDISAQTAAPPKGNPTGFLGDALEPYFVYVDSEDNVQLIEFNGIRDAYSLETLMTKPATSDVCSYWYAGERWLYYVDVDGGVNVMTSSNGWAGSVLLPRTVSMELAVGAPGSGEQASRPLGMVREQERTAQRAKSGATREMSGTEPAPPLPDPPGCALVDADEGRHMVAAKDSDGKMNVWTGDGSQWTPLDVNISQVASQPFGFFYALHGEEQEEGPTGPAIVYRGTEGHVWWAYEEKSNIWQSTDLNLLCNLEVSAKGSPVARQDPDASSSGAVDIHVVFRDEDDNVHDLVISPSEAEITCRDQADAWPEKDWWTGELKADQDPTVYYSHDAVSKDFDYNYVHVIVVTDALNIHEIYSQRVNGGYDWGDTKISALSDGYTLSGPAAGFSGTDDVFHHLVFLASRADEENDKETHLFEYWMDPQSDWQLRDLSIEVYPH